MNSIDFYSDKIITLESIINKLPKIRPDKTIITTNGCFDIIHPGHIKFLENAKALGDILIIALNSDNSVRSIKGENRPIIDQDMRAYALASLIYSDYIVIFEESTPENLLRLIKPDIHVKGEEYKESGIPEQEAVISGGGNVVYLPLIKGLSTTSLIDKMQD